MCLNLITDYQLSLTLQGNVSGHNEFVVYNAYRVLPEYILKYYVCSRGARGGRARKGSKHAAPAFTGPKLSVQRCSRAAMAAVAPPHWQHLTLGSAHTPSPLVTAAMAATANQPGASPRSAQPRTTTSSSRLSNAVSVSTATATAAPAVAGPASSAPSPPTTAAAATGGGVALGRAAVRFDHCLLCGLGMAVCRCGLTPRGSCRYCHHHSLWCTCPVYRSASGEVLPYRCLTSVLQKSMGKLPV